MTKNILSEKLMAPLNGARNARVDIQAGDGNLTIDELSDGEQVLASGTLQYQEGQGIPTPTLDANNGQARLTLRGGGSQTWFRVPWAACKMNRAPAKSAAAAKGFLAALQRACPIRITRILTDNGVEFTDRLFGSRARAPSGNHEIDRLCQALGIEHRLTKPRTPQTNGMVERFNGRIADILKTHHFTSGEDLRSTLVRYAWLYNHHLPQKALDQRSPIEAKKHWYTQRPDLFTKKPRNHPGPNT